MADIRDYSVTPASNTDIFPEGMAPSAVNDGGRAFQAEVAQLIKDESGTLTTGGTSTAYTLTLNTSPTALADGLYFSFTANATCGASPALTVTPSGGSAFASKKFRKFIGTAETDLIAGDMVANGHYLIQYDSAADGGTGAYIVLNPAGSRGWTLIETQTASSSATIDFTSSLTAANAANFDDYMIVISNAKVATDDTTLVLRVGTGATPTWQSGVGAYWGAGSVLGSASVVGGAGAGIQMTAGAGLAIGNAAGENFSGEIRFTNPDATDYPNFRFSTVYNRSTDGTSIGVQGSGNYGAAVAITGVRLLAGAGNIASGTFRLYGLAK